MGPRTLLPNFRPASTDGREQNSFRPVPKWNWSIASGQPLYLLDVNAAPAGAVLKVPAANFSAFVGDLLFVNEGGNCPPAAVFIAHWDGARFLVREIDMSGTALEHAAFAPIDIPPLP
jgi:hypothetical protein